MHESLQGRHILINKKEDENAQKQASVSEMKTEQ